MPDSTSRGDGQSHIAYRNEISDAPMPRVETEAAAAD